MTLRPPQGGESWTQLIALLREEMNRKEPLIIGWRHDGTNLHVRFRAPLLVPWVQVHVQSDGAGQGGFGGYDPDNSVSSTETDCRSDRVQDVTLADLPYSRYHVYLVPVQYDGASTPVKVLYNGESGQGADHMVFIDIGV